MWYHTEQGILEAMRAGQYVDVWIALLLPGLIAALGTSTTWTGGGEP